MFRSKNKKNIYTPANPSFVYIQVGFEGYSLHGNVLLMAFLVSFVIFTILNSYPGSQKSLSRKKKKFEVTSPAIVVLKAFLDSSDLPNEGLSGLLWNFFFA